MIDLMSQSTEFLSAESSFVMLGPNRACRLFASHSRARRCHLSCPLDWLRDRAGACLVIAPRNLMYIHFSLAVQCTCRACTKVDSPKARGFPYIVPCMQDLRYPSVVNHFAHSVNGLKHSKSSELNDILVSIYE